MAIFQCDICAATKESELQPDFCESCGTQNGPWAKTVDGLTRVHLTSGSGKYIVYSNRDLTRIEFKEFFSELKDGDGDGIYKYCEPGRVMLRFTQNPDGALDISSPEAGSNYFTLNGGRIESSPIRIHKGDRISLFSVNQMTIVADFDIS